MPKTMIDAVSSIVMTGRRMNGLERPDENWTSLPRGRFFARGAVTLIAATSARRASLSELVRRRRDESAMA